MSATQESAPAPDRLDGDGPKAEGADVAPVLSAVRNVRGPLLLVLVAVLLTATGGWFLAQSLHVRYDGPATNHALIDQAATNRVIGDVSDGLDQIFSYSYNDTGATRQAAASVLTGKAAGQYNTLFGQIRQHALAQQLSLTSRVVSAGVTQLDGGRAQLLVFLDQTATRGDTGQTSAAAAQLSIGAQLVGGRWLIADIHAR